MESNKLINTYTKEHIRKSPRAERPQVHKTRPYKAVLGVAHPQGVEGSSKADPGEALGSPWPPLIIRLWVAVSF
jgi:hypothetical protein